MPRRKRTGHKRGARPWRRQYPAPKGQRRSQGASQGQGEADQGCHRSRRGRKRDGSGRRHEAQGERCEAIKARIRARRAEKETEVMRTRGKQAWVDVETAVRERIRRDKATTETKGKVRQ